MSAGPTSTLATGRPTDWVTPMLIPGDGHQTVAYASFISAEEISSKTRVEVFEITCAPSQCATEVPKQTITQSIEMYVCPGDSDYCDESVNDKNEPPTTWFGYPLGWNGAITEDGTTTDWKFALSMLKDNERSSGATGDDILTYMATTKVGNEVKATTSTQDVMNESACLAVDHYLLVSVTAGVQDMLKDYPDQMFPTEPLQVSDFVPLIQSQRAACAKQTSGSLASQVPKETGKSDNNNNDKDNDNASGKTSLNVVLMTALLAVSVMAI